MVFITLFWILCYWPTSLSFIAVINATTLKIKMTKGMNWINVPWSFHMMMQPIIYILLFKRMRNVFVKVICCKRCNEGEQTVTLPMS